MRPSKRDELVRKALAVFYRNGFNATGMDMLVAETGISKTSMYNFPVPVRLLKVILSIINLIEDHRTAPGGYR